MARIGSVDIHRLEKSDITVSKYDPDVYVLRIGPCNFYFHSAEELLDKTQHLINQVFSELPDSAFENVPLDCGGCNALKENFTK